MAAQRSLRNYCYHALPRPFKQPKAPHPTTHILNCSHLPVNKAAWQDVKGAMVLAGTYEEAVKMMGDMNFLQVRLAAFWAGMLRSRGPSKPPDLLLGEQWCCLER